MNEKMKKKYLREHYKAVVCHGSMEFKEVLKALHSMKYKWNNGKVLMEVIDDELVLVAEDGGNFGSKERPISYRVSGKCWVNNHAHVLKAKEIVDTDYLCYSLMFFIFSFSF